MKKNIAGQRFGRLIAIEAVDKYKDGSSIWMCLCDCGKTSKVIIGNLTKGNTKSCGCLHSEKSSDRYSKINKRHGMTYSKIWRAWKGMNDRCSLNSKDFKNYAGRGITVCERWKIFENFAKDVSLPEFDYLSLDRIDNNKGYEPGNVRWATAKEQANNRRPRKG